MACSFIPLFATVGNLRVPPADISERRTSESAAHARLVATGPLEFSIETIPQAVSTAVLCSLVCWREISHHRTLGVNVMLACT